MIELTPIAQRLFPICRSITGNGVRETLNILKEYCPELTTFEIPSGTEVFDWTVPREWNIKDAYIADSLGNKIVDFQENNLHVMGYSIPVDKYVSREELLQNVYTLPDQPDAIPYVTSYYKERFGFCMTENQKNALKEDTYHIYIDSSLTNGSLTYGEVILEGSSKQEVFLSTYVCHPSMANNELSGPLVALQLINWLKTIDRRYTYRIIFIPETIGSITYLSRNYKEMQERVIAGFNISCVGDNNTYSYIESRYGNNLSDRVAKNVLQYHYPDYVTYSFLERGSDERQYCSPNINLPIAAICRTKYGKYKEYHTSLDDLSYISEEGLNGAFEVYRKSLVAIENNYTYKLTTFCEPQLGKRGLYPTISKKGVYDEVKVMTDFLAYINGKDDLITISNSIRQPIDAILPFAEKLFEHKLIERI